MIAFTVVLTMLSTASPVYAAEHREFHMSLYIHNWRGDTTSLEFYDGADASDEEASEPIIIVDDADEATTGIIVDEEEPTDASDEEASELIIIVDEEPEQEPTDEPVEQQIGVPDADIIVEDEEQVDESSDAPESEQISAVVIEEITSEALADSAEAQNAEQITIITTDNDTEEVDTITTEVGENDNNDEENSMAREE